MNGVVLGVVHGIITGLVTIAILSISQDDGIIAKITIAGLVLEEYITGLSTGYFALR